MANTKYYETIYNWFSETNDLGEFGKVCAEIQKAFSEAVTSYGYGVAHDIYASGYTDALYEAEVEAEENADAEAK